MHIKAENERLRHEATEKDLLLQHARITVMERGEQVKVIGLWTFMLDQGADRTVMKGLHRLASSVGEGFEMV